MQEKNIVTKKYWSDNARFADIINVGLFKAQKVLSANQLEEVDSALNAMVGKDKSKTGVQKYRDVVKKAAFDMIFAIVGIENQTDIHYAMPLKVMGYEYLDYDKQFQEIRKLHSEKKDLKGAEYISGFSKEDKLNPVCTLVLYYGEEPWDGPTKLSEMMNFENLPEEIRAVVADYPIHVIDMRRFEDSEKLETDSRLLFGTLQRQDDKEALEEYRKQNEEVFLKISNDTFEAIAVLTNSKEILKLKNKYEDEEGEINMCKAFEDMKASAALAMKVQDVFEFLEELGNVPKDIEEKISAETNLEVLSKWMKLAARSESMEAFISKM